MENGLGLLCKHCGQRIYAAPKHCERVASCPTCGKQILVANSNGNESKAVEYTEVTFKCPECDQPVKALAEEVGTTIKHSLCGKKIEIICPEPGGAVTKSRPDYSHWIVWLPALLAALSLASIFYKPNSYGYSGSGIGFIVFGIAHFFRKRLRIILLKIVGREYL